VKKYKSQIRTIKNIFLFVFSVAFCSQLFSWGTQLANQPRNLLVFAGVVVCSISLILMFLVFNEMVKFIITLLSKNKEEIKN
jgi:hypothetical protein